jgi:hypothetical protein
VAGPGPRRRSTGPSPIARTPPISRRSSAGATTTWSSPCSGACSLASLPGEGSDRLGAERAGRPPRPRRRTRRGRRQRARAATLRRRPAGRRSARRLRPTRAPGSAGRLAVAAQDRPMLRDPEVELEHDAVRVLEKGTAVAAQQRAHRARGRPVAHPHRMAHPFERGPVEVPGRARRDVQEDGSLVPVVHGGLLSTNPSRRPARQSCAGPACRVIPFVWPTAST